LTDRWTMKFFVESLRWYSILGRHKIRRNGRNSHIMREKNESIKEKRRRHTSHNVIVARFTQRCIMYVFSNELFKILLQ
jgi:hypothetical protein